MNDSGDQTDSGQLRAAILTSAHHAHYVLPASADRGGAQLSVDGFTALLVRLRAEKIGVRPLLARVKVDVANRGGPLAALLRDFATLHCFFDDGLDYIDMVGNYKE